MTPATGASSIRDILNGVGAFISTKIMPILVALVIIFFLWNMIMFLTKQGSETERESFRKYTINALIGIFILLTMWGIVGLGTRTLFGTKPFIPQFPTKAN